MISCELEGGSDGGGENIGLVRFDAAFGVGAGQIQPTDEITSAQLEYFVSNDGAQASPLRWRTGN